MSIENPLKQANQEKVIFDFILKLAASEDQDESSVVEAMVRQLECLRESVHLPDMLDILNPSRYHPETKLLSEEGKARLTHAIDLFIKE